MRPTRPTTASSPTRALTSCAYSSLKLQADAGDHGSSPGFEAREDVGAAEVRTVVRIAEVPAFQRQAEYVVDLVLDRRRDPGDRRADLRQTADRVGDFGVFPAVV